MRPFALVFTLLAGFAAPASAHDFSTGKLIDLSHAYDSATIYWPTEEGFVLEREFAGKTPGGWYYAANKLRTPEHGGTHVDAPVHFAEGKRTVDQIPLEQLVGEAVVIDVTAACAKNRDHAISVADLAAWEKQHGRIPRGAIVLFRTGFSRHWPDRKSYLGTDERGPAAVAKLHFPGLHPDAARWLIAERKPKAVGIDSASIDPGQSQTFETHRVLFAVEIPAFENLTNLDALPARDFSLVALPMKIAGGTGGPLRAIAILRR
jgi:kynurenine formamidase